MDLKELLNIKQPELYDLKDEKGYPGNDSLEKMLAYKRSKDGFDCDGSLGKNYCKLIREIYRMLWGWQDIVDEDHVKRYGEICIDDGFLMGPETMNSFQTTYNISEALGINDREMLVLFANSVGRIGNMTLTYAGFNKYIAYDYWDIKINRQYLDNVSLSDTAKTRYINLFFQWDYVTAANNRYVLKTFWNGHERYYKPGKEEIHPYIKLVDIYTERRGIFMIGMLRIAGISKDDYKLIRDKILISNTIFHGYLDVINQAKKLEYSNRETYNILGELHERIEEINQ